MGELQPGINDPRQRHLGLPRIARIGPGSGVRADDENAVARSEPREEPIDPGIRGQLTAAGAGVENPLGGDEAIVAPARHPLRKPPSPSQRPERLLLGENDKPAGREPPEARQGRGEGMAAGWMVDEHIDILAAADPLETPRHPAGRFEAPRYQFHRHPLGDADRRREEPVADERRHRDGDTDGRRIPGMAEEEGLPAEMALDGGGC